MTCTTMDFTFRSTTSGIFVMQATFTKREQVVHLSFGENMELVIYLKHVLSERCPTKPRRLSTICELTSTITIQFRKKHLLSLQ